MLDRTKAPDIQEIETVSLPTAEVIQLKNGGTVHIIQNRTQPVIRLDFVFKAGKWQEKKSGVSDLSNKMLFEGSKNYTAKQIAEKVAFYGASFENNHGYDRSEFTLYCLSKYLLPLLPVVVDVLQSPVFPEKEYELLKQRNQQNLKVQRQKNSYLATHRFTKLIYGDNHPYIFGFDENALDPIQLDDIKDFYKDNINKNELEVFVCGDIREDVKKEVIEELEKLDLKNNKESSKEKYINNAATSINEAFIHIDDSLQSSIRIGKQFPKIGDPDYHKLVVLSEILGGYFGSRLMRNIREDKGYTYGIYSTISPKEEDSLFYIGTDVNYTVTEKTVDEVQKEIRKLQEELVPEDELNTVQNYMVGKFLNDIATIFEQCDRYKRIVLSKLSPEHYNNYIKTIKTITTSELNELANRYLDLDSMSTAIAGRNPE